VCVDVYLLQNSALAAVDDHSRADMPALLLCFRLCEWHVTGIIHMSCMALA